MEIIKRVLGNINGGKVLDIATQEGGFIHLLIDNLKGYSTIVGIDIDACALETARSAISRERVCFLLMDAENLAFEDRSFDTVSVSASLHHLENITRVMKEVKRILKPGGRLILLEMHRNAQMDAQFTSVHLHHWAAEVDCTFGRFHNKTLRRQELINHVANLSLQDLEIYDVIDAETDPLNEERIEYLQGVVNKITQRAKKADHSQELIKQGEQLRIRLKHVGALPEPKLLIIGKK